MHFILTPGSIAKFDNLRKTYEAVRHVDLAATPSMLGTPVFFGGTDILSRNKQVSFLEKVKTVLNIHLMPETEIKTAQQRQAYIIAVRIMIAALLYVKSQIKSSKRNSALYRIIDDQLGVTAENYFDDEDKEIACLTADRLIKTPGAFEQANEVLQKEGPDLFTEKEWREFSEFLKENSRKETKDDHAHFPVISLTKPLFGAAFSYVGATIGVVLAEGASNSTSAISPRLQLTALVGSTLLVLSPTGTTGVALFAPVIATKLLTSFCTISLAHAMGTAAGLLGQGVGIGVGLPFDLAYNLLASVCSVISRYYKRVPKLACIDGLRIGDGATIIAGIPVQLISEHALPKGYTTKILEITENGEIHIEGEEIKSTDTPMQIPAEVLDELKKQLAIPAQKPESTRAEVQLESETPKTEQVEMEQDEFGGLTLI